VATESADTGVQWERALATHLGGGWIAPSGADRGADLISSDGHRTITTKYFVQGARDLHASLMQLAIYLTAHPAVRTATFVVRLPRMSAKRVSREWKSVTSVLRPELSRRLALVAVAPDGDAVIPDDAETRSIAEHAHHALAAITSVRAEDGHGAARWSWSPKSYEVWKVLLGAWLRRERALPLHEIQRRSGTSYPIVSALLDRLETLGELERSSNRSATLTDLPRRSLGEVLVLGLRETHHFVDRSGRPSNARDLIRRIIAKAPEAALAGVEAARHYMPDFNLNGHPRIDVTIGADLDLSWVKRVDPALAAALPASVATDPALAPLVVHRVRRPESGFIRYRGTTYADPAEVLLDLYELRLPEQANELVHSLRERSDR
jgi:hypothetical protein